jgi:hypothetical protein
VMDASVAASSTTARNMTRPQDTTEHRENVVHLMFQSQALAGGHFRFFENSGPARP